MGRKLLILSYYFAPMNRIGAIRPTKLAKYLARMGYEVTVVCGRGTDELTDPLLERDLQELPDVRIIEERNWIRLLKTRSTRPGAAKPPRADAGPQALPRARGSLKARLADDLYRYLRYRADGSFYRRALRALRSSGERFDAVFASYGPLSVQRLAWQCKRLGVAKRWIADFRDEVRYPFGWQAGARKRYLRRVRKGADVITSAAPGCLRLMGLEERGTVLYNGYDREDLANAEPTERVAGRFTLLYCGTLFPGFSDITPVLRCLRELMESGEMEPERVRVQYLGGTESLFWEQARAAGVAAQCESLGLVDRRVALGYEQAADALLLALRNDANRYGVLTGKYLEYLMMEKPVIGCVSGDWPDSDIARHIRTGRVGCCYEEAAGEDSMAALRAYLLALYRRAAADEAPQLTRDVAYVDGFDYRTLVKRLDGLLSGQADARPQETEEI